MESTATPLGIGLVGLGRHGRRYANHLVAKDVPGARLAAFWRRDATTAATDEKALGVPFVADIETLIAGPDVDAVIVVVPVGLHESIALEVAAQSKPLLIEKPLAPTVRSGTRIAEAFDNAKVPAMVAQTLRFDPAVLALRDRVAEIGAIRAFEFEQRLEPRGLAWEDENEHSAGGVLIQTGIHSIDALRFVTPSQVPSPQCSLRSCGKSRNGRLGGRRPRRRRRARRSQGRTGNGQRQ